MCLLHLSISVLKISSWVRATDVIFTQIVNSQQCKSNKHTNCIILYYSTELVFNNGKGEKKKTTDLYEDIHALMVKHDEELSLVLWNHDLPHRCARVLQRSLNITVMRGPMSTPIWRQTLTSSTFQMVSLRKVSPKVADYSSEKEGPYTEIQEWPFISSIWWGQSC